MILKVIDQLNYPENYFRLKILEYELLLMNTRIWKNYSSSEGQNILKTKHFFTCLLHNEYFGTFKVHIGINNCYVKNYRDKLEHWTSFKSSVPRVDAPNSRKIKILCFLLTDWYFYSKKEITSTKRRKTKIIDSERFGVLRKFSE